jgi:16S rRNA (guanine966-N2)-methyltransferase
MENRRPINSNAERPFPRNKFPKRSGDRTYPDKRFQSRDENFRQKDGSYPPKKEGGYQPRGEGGFQNRDNKFQTRDSRFQKRDNSYQSRDSKFQSRDGKFPSRDNKFDPKKRFPAKGKPPAPAWKNDTRPKVYSEMQVTDGKHRGKFLQSTTSPKIRPTSRRVREVMFRLISRRIRGKRFLDLCAGSGAVGIEAISRGALLGTFVERSAKMCSFIRKNMEIMGIKEGHGEVFESEVVPFLKQMSKRRRFWDVVFLDPPYDANYDEFLEYFGRGVCVKPRGILIIEHHAEMFFPEKVGVMRRWRVIVEGDTGLSFYERVA